MPNYVFLPASGSQEHNSALRGHGGCSQKRMACPHFKLLPITRGSTRQGKVRPAKLDGSAARRCQYIERGGTLSKRADEVLGLGRSGPDLSDWRAVDRAERRADACVGYELVAAVPAELSLAEQMHVAQAEADRVRRLTGCAVRWALHRASKEADQRAVHVHFLISTRAISNTGRIAIIKSPKWQQKTGGCELVAALRACWQDLVNAALTRAGSSDRLDLRTLTAQGIQRPAQQRVSKIEYLRARRGEIHSPRYARNQSIARLSAATSERKTATRAHAAARRSFTRADRADRRTRSRRKLDFARSAARAQSVGFSGNQGSRDHFPADQRRERPVVHADVAGAVVAGERPGGPVPALDVRATVGDHRRAGIAPDREAVVAARQEPAQATQLTTVGDVLLVHTITGGTFHVLAADLDHARQGNQTNVPLCDPGGRRIEELHPHRLPGDPRGRLRLSSIVSTEALPVPQVQAEPVAAAPASTVAGLVLDPVDEQEQGYSL